MELLHKQEELEQLELEQALAISLAIEEERLRLLELEAQNDFEDDSLYDRKGDENIMVFIHIVRYETTLPYFHLSTNFLRV